MAYQDWFDSFQRGEVALRGYFSPPGELTAERIMGADHSAADLQRRAQALIDDLAEYRQALADRYAALTVMPYTLHLELTRHRSYTSGLVTYDLRINRRYEDGTETAELQEHYSGKERRQALARFEALRKERPGITATLDIARKAWER